MDASLSETKLAALDNSIAGLNKTEQSFAKEQFYDRAKKWAELLDTANALRRSNEDLLHMDRIQQLDEANSQFDAFLEDLRQLNLSENPERATHLRNRLDEFKNNRYVENLIFIIQLLNSATVDTSKFTELKSLIKQAEKAEKSFSASIEKGRTEIKQDAARTLAVHFQKRIDEIEAKENKAMNPAALLNQRNNWLFGLGVFVLGALGYQIVSVVNNWEVSLQLAAAKLTFIALIYSQVYFKQKNYNIYSDLLIRYKHLHVIASTITDFLGPEVDQTLKTKLVDSGVNTLFGAIENGHLKTNAADSGYITNIIDGIANNRSN